VTLVAARLFARRLDRLGVRFRLPEALIGLLTALAADGPEIGSALFALVTGAHGVSVGVLVGSNVFNLAAMVGVTGLIVGGVRLARSALLLEGSIAVAITLIGAGVLLRWLSPGVAAGVAACAVVPYLSIVVGGVELVARLSGGNRLGRVIAEALAQRPRSELPPVSTSDPTHYLLALIVLDVVVIIAGSAGMVQTAISLGHRWHISDAILGMLILAPLTSIPNAATALRLGLAGRGAALVGETFNSNTINLLVGVIVPALFVTFAALSSTAKIQLAWLVAMTFACLLLLMRARGMRRPGAAFLVLLYLGFVAVQLSSG
jgi:cation:H+ antiporter